MTPEQSHGIFTEFTTKKDETTGLSLVETMDPKELVALKRGWEAMREHSMSLLGFQTYLAYMALEAGKRSVGKMKFSIQMEVLEDLSVNMMNPTFILEESKNKPIASMKKQMGQQKMSIGPRGYKERKK